MSLLFLYAKNHKRETGWTRLQQNLQFLVEIEGLPLYLLYALSSMLELEQVHILDKNEVELKGEIQRAYTISSCHRGWRYRRN